MSEREGFLEAIRRDDSDAPRLIYADWLGETGEPERAEFIRLGCELASLTGDAPKGEALQARHDELHRWHAEGWLGRAGLGLLERFDRGVVTGATCVPSEFLRTSEQLFCAEPIRRLELLVEPGETLRGVADRPELARLARLDLLMYQVDWDGYCELIHAPTLAGLREFGWTPDEGMPWVTWDAHSLELLDSPTFAGLTGFHLDGRGSVDVAGAFVSLVFARSPAKLRSLSLVDCGLTEGHAQTLSLSDFCSGLTNLKLGGSELGARGMSYLLKARWFGGLKSLDVSGRLPVPNPHVEQVRRPNVGEQGVVTLARWPAAARLRRLDLSANDIGPAAVRALIDSPHLAGLEMLTLGETEHLERGGGSDDPVIGVENCRRLREKFGDRVKFV